MDYLLMKRAVVGRVPMMCDIRKILQFFRMAKYNTDAHNTHVHTIIPMNITYTNPIPMSTFEGLSTRQIWRFPKSPLAPRCRRERRLPLNA
jgi:hypothetical protein